MKRLVTIGLASALLVSANYAAASESDALALVFFLFPHGAIHRLAIGYSIELNGETVAAHTTRDGLRFAFKDGKVYIAKRIAHGWRIRDDGGRTIHVRRAPDGTLSGSGFDGRYRHVDVQTFVYADATNSVRTPPPGNGDPDNGSDGH